MGINNSPEQSILYSIVKRKGLNLLIFIRPLAHVCSVSYREQDYSAIFCVIEQELYTLEVVQSKDIGEFISKQFGVVFLFVGVSL